MKYVHKDIARTYQPNFLGNLFSIIKTTNDTLVSLFSFTEHYCIIVAPVCKSFDKWEGLALFFT